MELQERLDAVRYVIVASAFEWQCLRQRHGLGTALPLVFQEHWLSPDVEVGRFKCLEMPWAKQALLDRHMADDRVRVRLHFVTIQDAPVLWCEPIGDVTCGDAMRAWLLKHVPARYAGNWCTPPDFEPYFTDFLSARGALPR